MSVVLTSPVFGKSVGDTFTGSAAEEDWALASGYAKRTPAYVGPGTSNTGPAHVVPAKDLTKAENREAADDRKLTNDDPFATTGMNYDFDSGQVDDDLPTVNSASPATGPAAGGTQVTFKGLNLKQVTGVTFGGTAGTALTKTDKQVKVTAPAHAAGAVAVVFTGDPQGSVTKTAFYTYT